MADIFISYSHKDQNYVQELTGYLKNKGFSVWVDERIDHGDRWWQTIVSNIRKCAAMVVVMTPDSEKTDWVEREYFFADRIKKPIFPLLLGGECFPFFVNRHYSDVRDRSMPPNALLGTLKQFVEQANEERNRKEEEQKRIEAARKAEEERKQKEAETKRKIDEEKRRKEREEQERKAAEEKRRKEQELRKKAEKERLKKETEAKRKADEDQKRRAVMEKIKPHKPEPAKIKSPVPKRVSVAATKSGPSEPVSLKPHKTNKVLKIGVLAGVAVFLIAGIWLWVSNQQAREVGQEMANIDSEVNNLEKAIADIYEPEQIEKLYSQRDKLNNQVSAFSEQATNVGLGSQLEQLQDHLKKVDIQLANKEKELIAARKVITNSIGMEFVLIPAGKFVMGSPPDEPDRNDDEKQHEVRITKPFYLQTTEVSRGQWKKVMGDKSSEFEYCGDDCPVEEVSWNDTQKFISKLNQIESTNKYRLPTEAEWEYACRAGKTTPFFTGDCISTDQANYDGDYPAKNCPKGQYRRETVKVGSFQPNAWGLYDMHGNVWEWCQDWYGEYPSNSVVDPKGPNKGEKRVWRGGSWYDKARYLRSANRDRYYPGNEYRSHLGFRVARDFLLHQN